ncbi:MAG: hypothetical protein Q8M31_01450, partial [Beijerinckiaceae bacterium]|nr:hypothetical protein [Beijerinckiaceae bacterium]
QRLTAQEYGVLDKRDRQRISHDEPKFTRKDAAVHVSLPSDSNVKQRIKSPKHIKAANRFRLIDRSRSIRLFMPREARDDRGPCAAMQRRRRRWAYIGPLGVACQHDFSKNCHLFWRAIDQAIETPIPDAGHIRATMLGLLHRFCGLS